MDSHRIYSITRIVQRRLVVDSMKKVRLLSKNSCSKALSVAVNVNDGSAFTISHRHNKMEKEFIKLFRKLKSIKKLDLQKGWFYSNSRNNQKLIKQIKQYSRIQEIILPDSNVDDLYQTIFICGLWLKYGNKLEKLDAVIPFLKKLPRGTIFRNKFFYKYLKSSSLKALSLNNWGSLTPLEILQLTNYPSTLKKLSLNLNRINPQTFQVPHNLLNLKSLNLCLPLKNSVLWNGSLDSITKLRHLDTLILKFPRYSGMIPPISKFFIQNIPNLVHRD